MDKKYCLYGSIICILFITSLAGVAFAQVSVSRDLPSTVKRGSNMEVSVSVNVDENDLPNALGLSETTPSGVTVSEPSSNGVVFGDTTEWLFLKQDLLTEILAYLTSVSLDALEDSTVTYTVRIPKDYSESSLSFEGVYLVGSTSSSIGGDQSVTVSGIYGDTNNDDTVDYYDLLALASAYSSSQGDDNYNSNTDFNGDGTVNFSDLLVLADNYTP